MNTTDLRFQEDSQFPPDRTGRTNTLENVNSINIINKQNEGLDFTLM